MKQLIFFIAAFCSAASILLAEEVSVSLNQKKVTLNDPISLTFSTSHSVKHPPDFSALQLEFDIISNSQNRSISIVNGHIAQDTHWQLTLMPKHTGNITIPSIQFDEYHSSPQLIEVTEASPAKRNDAIFIEAELSPQNNAYEQALLIYTARLFYSAQLAQATLSDPIISDKDAIIERLGNDAEYDHYDDNGKHYRVYERTYAISPQHPGELVFSPLVFDGAIISGNTSFFDMQTKRMRLHSEQKTITVNPIPTPFEKHNWLAANDVQVTENWSSSPEKSELGEPLTWTVTVTAKGCLGSQIPNPPLHFPSSVKHYVDKPETSNQIAEHSCTGVKQIKIALIPSATGEIELPSISIPWWNLKTNQIQHAELPSKKMFVRSGSIAMNIHSSGTEPVSPQITQNDAIASEQTSILPRWEAFAIIAASIFIPMLSFIIYRKRKSKGKKPDSLSQIKKHLKAACQQGEAKLAETYLLAWFSTAFSQPKPLNILAIKTFVSEELGNAIRDLYEALYSKQSNWNGEALWKACNDVKQKKIHNNKLKKQQRVLKELYPQ